MFLAVAARDAAVFELVEARVPGIEQTASTSTAPSRSLPTRRSCCSPATPRSVFSLKTHRSPFNPTTTS
jgi:hypothetical protein